MQGSPVQFQFEDVSPVEKRLKIEVAREHVSQKLDAAYRKLSKEVALRGFRKGKVPRSYLEKLFARKVENDVRNELISETLMYVAQQSKVSMLDQPSIEHITEVSKDKGLQYSARFEVVPTITAAHYSGMEVEQPSVEVTAEQVDEALQHRRKEQQHLLPIEDRDSIARTDVVSILASGKAFNQTWNNREFDIDMSEDDKRFPGLAEALVGQSFTAADLKYDLPAQQPGAPPYPITVSVKAVHLKQLPELDDDFAKETGDADTLAELRDKVRAELTKHQENHLKAELRDKLLEDLVLKNPVPIPSGWLSRQVAAYLKESPGGLFQEALRRGIPESGVTEDSMRKLAEELATRQLAVELILRDIADQEKVELTDADVELRLAETARNQDKSVTRVRAEMQKEDPGLTRLRENMRLEKALDLVESRAKIKVTPAEAK